MAQVRSRTSQLLTRVTLAVLVAVLVGGALVSCGTSEPGGSDPGNGGASGGAGSSGTGGSGSGVAGSGGSAGQGGSSPAGAAGRGGGGGGQSGGGVGGTAGHAAGSGGAGAAGGSAGGGGGGAAGSAGGSAGAGTGGGSAGRGGTGGGQAGRGGTGAAGTGGRGGGGGGAGTTGKLRVMPLGDSTTASICYRAYLWQMLTQSGHTNFDFVGTRNGDPGCGVSGYDRDNEGHGGYITTDVLKAAGTGTRPGGADANDPFVSDARDLVTWFDGHPADIALMHFGTNDVWNNKSPAMILQAYSAILAKLRSNNPNVRLYVAQITSLAPSGCSDCPSRVQTLNGMIPGWASTNSTTASPITVVDQNAGFSPGTDTNDGVHSNSAGAMKIATKWYSVLMSVL